MPSSPSGNAKGRELARAAVGEEKLQLAEHQVPILTFGMPMFYNPLGRQIEHSPQRIVVGKAGFVLGDLPELTVQALYNVSRVYDFPNFRPIFKNVLRISQLSSQFLTQKGDCLRQVSENRRRFSSASSRVTEV